jgi:hypothetical protein
MGIQKHHNKRFTKKTRRKGFAKIAFCKTIDKKKKTVFVLSLLLGVSR